jgi:predicted nucleic acid-binding protein
VIVADASIVVAAVMESGTAGAAARHAMSHGACAPAHLDAEVGSALRRLVLHGALSAARARTALNDLAALPLVRAPLPLLLPEAWRHRDEVSFYDSLYVSLSRALKLPLVTADRGLARAASRHCEVQLLS